MPTTSLKAYGVYLLDSDTRSVVAATTSLPQLLRIETTFWSPSIFAQNLGVTFS